MEHPADDLAGGVTRTVKPANHAPAMAARVVEDALDTLDVADVADANVLDVACALRTAHLTSLAYVTIVFRTPDAVAPSPYLNGVENLAKSLRATNSKIPLWCMAANLNTEEIDRLWACCDNVFIVDLIHVETVPLRTKKQRSIYPWIEYACTKWNALALPAKKILFIDADFIFVSGGALDCLFNLQAPAAVWASPWASPWVETRTGRQGPMNIVNRYPTHHSAVVPMSLIKHGLRAGFVAIGTVMLLEPSPLAFETFLEVISHQPFGSSVCISGFDEQAIAMTLVRMGQPVSHIHQRYAYYAGKDKWIAPYVPHVIQWYNDKPWNSKPGDWPADDIWIAYKYMSLAEIAQHQSAKNKTVANNMIHLFVSSLRSRGSLSSDPNGLAALDTLES